MTYRVFDVSISRLMGVYKTEAEAMTLARTLIESNGEEYAEDLAVSHEREDGTFETPWTGGELVIRAERILERQGQTASAGSEVTRSSSGEGSGSYYPERIAADGYNCSPSPGRKKAIA